LFFSVSFGIQHTLAFAQKKTVAQSEKTIKVDQSPIGRPKFENNFKQKYTASEFQYEVKLDQESLWDKFKAWLSYWFKKIFGLSNTRISGEYVDITLRVIAIAIVSYVVYLIVKIILNKEGQWVFGKSTTKKIIYDDDIEKNLIHIDFEKLIKETLKEGNNRLVIRYYYLWVLKNLSEKNIIEWHVDKTNTEYLYEIQSADLKTNFQYLSYLYSYIWYGEFEINDHTFQQAQKAFENTIDSLKR
jgi:hypothetical protein